MALTLPRENLAPRLSKGLALLDALGVPVSRGSRVVRCLELAENLPDLAQPDGQLQDRATAFVDGAALADIFDALPSLLESCSRDVLLDDLRKLVAGSFEIDAQNDAARSKQLELWTAALCARAGLRPRLAEPDVLFELEGQTYAIAAKRPQTSARLKDRLLEGIAQVRRTPHQGFLVVDLSRVWGFHQEALVVGNGMSAEDHFRERARALGALQLPERWLRRKDRRFQIEGIVCAAFGMVLDVQAPAYTSGQWLRCEPLHPDGRWDHLFFRALASAALSR